MHPLMLVLEHDGQALTGVSSRLCANAYRFAGQSGRALAAVLFADCQEKLLPSLGVYGISKIYHAPGTAEDFIAPEIREAVIASACKSAGASILLLPGSLRGRDVAPLLARRLDAVLIAECVQLQWTDGVPEAVVNAYCNQYQRIYRLAGGSQVVLMADVDCGPFAQKQPVIPVMINLEAKFSDACSQQVLESFQVPAGALDVTEADIVVGVGQGVASCEEMEQVRELAALMDASLGGTRPAVDAGLIGENRQLGQTGRAIAPALYLAVGVSGAQQHLSGIAAGKVVAINIDAQAPIHQAADLGVVGDLKAILPLLISRLKHRAKEEQQ